MLSGMLNLTIYRKANRNKFYIGGYCILHSSRYECEETMIRRCMSVLIILWYLVADVCAQREGKAVLHFDATVWNFSHIREAEGKVSPTSILPMCILLRL